MAAVAAAATALSLRLGQASRARVLAAALAAKHIALVAAGGACGATLRYLVQGWAASWELPWGTLLVNATGSLAIGIAIGAGAGAPWFEAGGRTFLVAGVLGAFTTFSAFSADALRLAAAGRLAWAAAYVAGSVGLSLAAAFLGHGAGQRLGAALP